MKGKRKGKIAADSLVILCGLIIAGYVIIELLTEPAQLIHPMNLSFGFQL